MNEQNQQPSKFAIAENGNEYYEVEWDRKTRQWFVVRSVFTQNHFATPEDAQAHADKLNAKSR